MVPWIEEVAKHNKHISKRILFHGRKRFIKELERLLFRIFGETVSDELFSMCIEYPDSQPILEDLRYCLKVTNIRDVVVSKLKSDLERRLLHTGVTTADVVDAYVAVVRSLKFLDSDRILLQLVTPPVRDYLKQREETIRVILVSLTDESGELADELINNPSDEDDRALWEYKWASWLPDPIDIPKDKYNLRQGDMIQTLISIYGSKTLFMDEYRALLADRLLKMPKPATIPHEVKCLELLKLRFGDTDLQKCEVMLKDITDSQRMNTRFNEELIAGDETMDFAFSALIVSAQFWPVFKEQQLELPSGVHEAMERYRTTFEGIKGNRSLEWHSHVGNVELEVDDLGSSVTYTCAPVHASILWNFQEKSHWSLAELSDATKLPVSQLRSRIRFWVTRGVISQIQPDVYSLQEDEATTVELQKVDGTKSTFIEDEEMDSPMASTTVLRENELQIFWSYIEGMLTNLGTLPVTRIHSMLRLFSTVQCSPEELQQFLDEKVTQGQLLYSAEQYRLQR